MRRNGYWNALKTYEPIIPRRGLIIVKVLVTKLSAQVSKLLSYTYHIFITSLNRANERNERCMKLRCSAYVFLKASCVTMRNSVIIVFVSQSHSTLTHVFWREFERYLNECRATSLVHWNTTLNMQTATAVSRSSARANGAETQFATANSGVIVDQWPQLYTEIRTLWLL